MIVLPTSLTIQIAFLSGLDTQSTTMETRGSPSPSLRVLLTQHTSSQEIWITEDMSSQLLMIIFAKQSGLQWYLNATLLLLFLLLSWATICMWAKNLIWPLSLSSLNLLILTQRICYSPKTYLPGQAGCHFTLSKEELLELLINPWELKLSLLEALTSLVSSLS